MIFFFNDPATTEIYTLSLHDALPIWRLQRVVVGKVVRQPDVPPLLEPAQALHRCLDTRRHAVGVGRRDGVGLQEDRKSTRLNSSHANISYAVFCLKKKKHIHAVLDAP